MASGSNQNNWSIYFIGKNRNRRMFLAILSRIGVKYFWVDPEMEMSGCMWMHTFGVEAACMSGLASES